MISLQGLIVLFCRHWALTPFVARITVTDNAKKRSWSFNRYLQIITDNVIIFRFLPDLLCPAKTLPCRGQDFNLSKRSTSCADSALGWDPGRLKWRKHIELVCLQASCVDLCLCSSEKKESTLPSSSVINAKRKALEHSCPNSGGWKGNGDSCSWLLLVLAALLKQTKGLSWLKWKPSLWPYSFTLCA